MIEEFAMLASLFSVIIAIFSIIIILLLKKNVVDILNKDLIIFDKNFEIKKRAIDKSFTLLDELNKSGTNLIKNAEFKAQAVACYNELICVISDIKIADEFYAIAIIGKELPTESAIAKYKLDCRKDIGFKVKGANNLNEIINLAKNEKKDQNKKNKANNFETNLAKVEQNTNLNSVNSAPTQQNQYQNSRIVRPNITQNQNVQSTPIPSTNQNMQNQNIQPQRTIAVNNYQTKPNSAINSVPSQPNPTPEIKRRGRPKKS